MNIQIQIRIKNCANGKAHIYVHTYKCKWLLSVLSVQNQWQKMWNKSNFVVGIARILVFKHISRRWSSIKARFDGKKAKYVLLLIVYNMCTFVLSEHTHRTNNKEEQQSCHWNAICCLQKKKTKKKGKTNHTKNFLLSTFVVSLCTCICRIHLNRCVYICKNSVYLYEMSSI